MEKLKGEYTLYEHWTGNRAGREREETVAKGKRGRDRNVGKGTRALEKGKRECGETKRAFEKGWECRER